MRAGGGGQKGASFERYVCKQLSLWVSQGKREDIFWRSSMSGGRATFMAKRGKTNKSQVGDISAVDPAGEALLKIWCIECKHRRDLQIGRGLFHGSGFLRDFWQQAVDQAESVDKHPLLIARQNRLPIMVLAPLMGVDDERWEEMAAPLGRFDRWPRRPLVFLFDDLFKVRK